MCHSLKDLGRKTGTGHLFVGALLCPSWVGRGKGCWALWYLTATLALALSFFIRHLGLWVNSESQMINALPLGYFSRYRRFLRQHNNQSTSLLPLCVFKRKTFFFFPPTCLKRKYIFSILNPLSLQQVKPQLFVVPWSSTVVGATLKSNHHKKRLKYHKKAVLVAHKEIITIPSGDNLCITNTP